MLEDEITYINERTMESRNCNMEKIATTISVVERTSKPKRITMPASLATQNQNASQIARKHDQKATKGNTDRLRAQVLAARQSGCVKKS